MSLSNSSFGGTPLKILLPTLIVGIECTPSCFASFICFRISISLIFMWGYSDFTLLIKRDVGMHRGQIIDL